MPTLVAKAKSASVVEISSRDLAVFTVFVAGREGEARGAQHLLQISKPRNVFTMCLNNTNANSAVTSF